MHYLDALSDNLERVLMVHGSGREVITVYSWKNNKQNLRKYTKFASRIENAPEHYWNCGINMIIIFVS